MEEVPLLSVHDERRRRKAQEVLNSLKFHSDTFSDDSQEESGCSSQLSDPFSDMEEKVAPTLVANGKRRMTKIESDIMLMSSFTPNFMSVQKNLVNQMSSDSAICSDFSSNRNYTYLDRREPKESDERIKSRIQEMLVSCGIKSPAISRATESPDKPISTAAPSPALEMYNQMHGKSPMSDADNSSLSAVWRMLEAQSVENGFPVTPFGYNVFEDKRLEWMTRNSSWSDREQVREKCENWLKNIES